MLPILRTFYWFASLIALMNGVHGQSLADVARKERARRSQRSDVVKVLTEADLKAVSGNGGQAQRGLEPSELDGTNAKNGEISVPFTTRGNSMIVSAEINGRAQTRIIVDTGASLTSLSRALAESVGIQVNDKNIQLPVQTANGVTMAPLVKLSTLRIGEAVINDLDVILLDNWTDSEVTGLLGMNVLNQFAWQIDTSKNRLLLKPNPKPPSKETYGGYEKDWWIGQFRFLRQGLEQWQCRLDKTAGTDEADQIKTSMDKLEAQLDTLTRAANQAGVPRGWRR